MLLSNKICLEYGSNETVLSFVHNLYAVEPVTLWPAAILHSRCTRIVTFAISRIVHTRMSQINIFNVSVYAGYICSAGVRKMMNFKSELSALCATHRRT